MPVLTIRGQLGSGAPEIGKLVARKLNIDYVDRDIIEKVAKRIVSSERGVEAKEMPPGSLAGKIAEALSHYIYPSGGPDGFQVPYLPAWEILPNDPHYLAGLKSVIKELAASNSIIIRGRGSQFILKDYLGSLHVLTVAPLELRIQRVMKEMNADESTAKKEITLFDSSRREFIKRYFQTELENPLHYDLVINTERLSLEAAASTVISAVHQIEQQVTRELIVQ